MSNSDFLKKIYHRKVDLLINGLCIGEHFHESIAKFGTHFEKGRKGGAGPAGGRYFIFENDSPVNVSLWGSASEKSYLILEEAIRIDPKNERYIYCRIHNQNTDIDYDDIRLIPIPEEYNDGQNIDGLLNKQVALVHGTSCLASTIVQRCKYWRDGMQCAFCGIELSLNSGATIAKKSAEQLINSIKKARTMGMAEHMTLTSGTLEYGNKGIDNYIDIVSKIKKIYPEIPIHIQIEPVENIELLENLKNAGVNTIGIHLEIPNDELRKLYCPGKSVLSKNDFEKFWKEAIRVFGKAQVSTFILIGFDENIDELISYVDKIISWGVIPVIVPVRYIIGTKLDTKKNQLADTLKIYDAVGESFINYNLNPLKNIAGCVRCSGCSAIQDVYIYKKSLQK